MSFDRAEDILNVMDRLEIKLLAIFFCSCVIASRIPGILWPGKLKAFLSQYSSMGSVIIRFIGGLLLCLGLSILFILLKSVTLAKMVVMLGSAMLIASGILHFFPELLRKIIGKVEKRSPLTIRLVSILSLSLAVGIGIYLALRG